MAENSSNSANTTRNSTSMHSFGYAGNTFSNPLAMKLTSSNYLLWKKQVQAAVKAYKLQKYITNPDPPLLRTCTDGSPNIEYEAWEQQDQILVCWLYASISQEVLVQLPDCDTAFDIWKALEDLFMFKDKSVIMQIKSELQNLKKEGLTITEYLTKMKALIDSLAIAGCKLDEDEQVMYYLSGLGQEYDAVIVNVSSRIGQVRVRDLRSMLLNQEARLNQYNQSVNIHSPSVNYIANQNGNFVDDKYTDGTQNRLDSQNRYDTVHTSYGGNGQGFRGGYRGGNFDRGKGRGRGRFNGSNTSKPQCQLCLRLGHTVWKCFYRFDKTFQLNNSSSNAGSDQAAAYLLESPEINAVSEMEDVWYTDSGATHHCTPNSNNLEDKVNYAGPDKVQVGNGAEVFNKFKSLDGNFKESFTTDVKGLLSLYEASHLRVCEEKILDEALNFTTKHLEAMATQLGNSSLAKQIQHALKRPLRKGIPRLEARFYIQVYEEDPLHNEAILTFAKMDFNILQKVHQKELIGVQRWWKDLEFSPKLPFARDRVVECYFWTLGFNFESEYHLARRTLTKVLCMCTVIDDIYDVYGTIEELQLFTEAIERWDASATNLLPEYMKHCYEALLAVSKEIEKDIAFGDNTYRLYYTKIFMKDLVRNYLIEATWCNQRYVPTMEEYMEVALRTGGCRWVLAPFYMGMGEIATKEVFEWLFGMPKIAKASSTITRLMNDVAGHKFEQKRMHVASAVQCYMKQHHVSEEHTIKIFLKEIENAWKDVNEEYLKPTTIPMPLLEQVLNFTRTVDFLYKDDDYYTHSRFVEDQIGSLLRDPILF